jgi:hypothetical protein
MVRSRRSAWPVSREQESPELRARLDRILEPIREAVRPGAFFGDVLALHRNNADERNAAARRLARRLLAGSGKQRVRASLGLVGPRASAAFRELRRQARLQRRSPDVVLEEYIVQAMLLLPGDAKEMRRVGRRSTKPVDLSFGDFGSWVSTQYLGSSLRQVLIGSGDREMLLVDDGAIEDRQPSALDAPIAADAARRRVAALFHRATRSERALLNLLIKHPDWDDSRLAKGLKCPAERFAPGAIGS